MVKKQSKSPDKYVICFWNTRKESFIVNQEGEFDRSNADPEKSNDGELKP